MGFLARRRENEATGNIFSIHEDCELSGNAAKNSSEKSISEICVEKKEDVSSRIISVGSRKRAHTH
ncbi:hypothetical protein RVIR1_00600 [Candidatus Rickettsiella viridis]|uniref:Uncharacterized protein n=1 Tax=Candidatus Rickettsiella viridis TaxID=676208 RepID=A0A2Z5V2B5_9COXI|nr:hypothetical protein RVIR1_00600 [Candidatus Rickettsiella viridis]